MNSKVGYELSVSRKTIVENFAFLKKHKSPPFCKSSSDSFFPKDEQIFQLSFAELQTKPS